MKNAKHIGKNLKHSLNDKNLYDTINIKKNKGKPLLRVSSER